MLNAFPGITQSAVTDIEVKQDARVIMAFYTAPDPVDPAALEAYVTDNLAAYKRLAWLLPPRRAADRRERKTPASRIAADVQGQTWSSLISFPTRSALGAISGKPFWIRRLPSARTIRFRSIGIPSNSIPTCRREGMDRREYLEAKFGGQEGAVQAYLPVVEKAKEAGLDINFEGIDRTPNTLDAHRLIHWAGIEDRLFVVDALFKAYFVDGRDIGDPRRSGRYRRFPAAWMPALCCACLPTEEDRRDIVDPRCRCARHGGDVCSYVHRGQPACGFPAHSRQISGSRCWMISWNRNAAQQA